ncbi:ABC-2 type transport system ATP-binding protein [Ruminococcaceae bacterium FB2012]|nr:ABC-2 type transport system ATP-binding protein [Ruminococcaceae bacterium FB2012]
MGILEIKGLKKSFGAKTVLDGVDLDIPEHSIFGFIGPNGAGKTTAMKLILGLIKADGGEITVAGEKVRFGQTDTNRHIGYLPDVPEFYSFMTSREYLRFCGEITGLEDNDITDRTEELLEAVGLSEEKRRIKGWSRGMKQRLGIAQALLGRPRLLICDEPTSALDPAGRHDILEILRKARSQTTVLFSTHILSDIEEISTDAAFLNGGKIVLAGSMDQLRGGFGEEKYRLVLSLPEQVRLTEEHFGLTSSPEGITFSEEQVTVTELMRFLADKGFSPLKLERCERSLEDIFEEVIGA